MTSLLYSDKEYRLNGGVMKWNDFQKYLKTSHGNKQEVTDGQLTV